MLPPLPQFQANRVYLLTSRYINLVMDRILRQTPLPGDGIQFEETARGIALHAVRGVAPQIAPTLYHSFQVEWSGEDEVSVRGGIVAIPAWGTIDWSNPAPANWLAETAVAGDTLSVADGDSIWLQITIPRSDSTIAGPLPTAGSTPYVIETGAGGGGGQGGGGGGGGGAAGAGSAGGDGDDADGMAAGTGGDGGSNGGTSPGEGSGTAGFGGNGGDGGAGGAGEVNMWNHHTHLQLRMRRYNILSAGFVVDPNKPTSTDTDIHIRLAAISGGTITQYHAGTAIVTPPAPSFIP